MKKTKDEVYAAAEKASKDPTLLSGYLEGICSKDDKTRLQSHKVLDHLALEDPSVLYPHWDFLTRLLESNNHYHRFIALSLIGNLASVDSKNKFEKIMKPFFANIAGDRTMVAVQATICAGKIAKVKPGLQDYITNILLKIDTIHTGKQTELLKAAAIQAFAFYYNEIKDKKKILAFVQRQSDSKSPKTRKIAKEFLKTWSQ